MTEDPQPPWGQPAEVPAPGSYGAAPAADPYPAAPGPVGLASPVLTDLGRPGGPSRWVTGPGGSTFAPLEWPPPAAVTAPRRHRWAVTAVVVLLAATAGGLGYLALRNAHSASGWRRLDLAQVARNRQLTTELQTANQRIRTVDAQVASLGGQITNLQGRLSSVANQKEKAVDQETVLQQLLTAAGQVADALQQCITATNQFSLDLNSAVASPDQSGLVRLQAEATRADDTCSQAESANQNLQSAIQSAP